MRISLDRATLAHALTAVSKVVESRNTIPILSNVLLSVDGGRLTIKGTDLDIEASASVPVMDASDGATTVDAKLLTDIVKKASGDVTLETEASSGNDVLSVKSGRSRYRLQTLPASDYPDMTAGTFTTEFEVDLAALVTPVSFAMSTEMTRYYLCGVCLEGDEKRLAATATDGHRLATKSIAPATEFKSIILPAKLVSILPKGMVRVSLSETKIRIASDDGVITSKLIDGTFPDYERVIPRNNDKMISVEPDAVKRALSRVSVMLSERGGGAKFSIADNSITLTVSNPDGGTATEEVDAAYDGEPIEVGFNGQYVADVLSLFPAETVNIALADGGSPALLTSDGAPGVRAVVMPMRI